MAKFPIKFGDLTDTTQESLEQIAHFFMGFGAGLINCHALTWWREWKSLPAGKPIWTNGNLLYTQISFPVKRNHLYTKEYWPKDRVIDSFTDFKFYHYGYMAAGIIKDIMWICLGIWVW